MDIEDRKKIQRSMYNPVGWSPLVWRDGVAVRNDSISVVEPSKTWWKQRDRYWPSHVATGWLPMNQSDLIKASEAFAWCEQNFGSSPAKSPPEQQSWTFYQMAYRKGDRRTYVFFFREAKHAVAFKLTWC